MAKTVYYNPVYSKNLGVDVTYVQSRRVLLLGGWYDGNVGIGDIPEVPLGDFLRALGITERDCRAALAAQRPDAR